MLHHSTYLYKYHDGTTNTTASSKIKNVPKGKNSGMLLKKYGYNLLKHSILELGDVQYLLFINERDNELHINVKNIFNIQNTSFNICINMHEELRKYYGRKDARGMVESVGSEDLDNLNITSSYWINKNMFSTKIGKKNNTTSNCDSHHENNTSMDASATTLLFVTTINELYIFEIIISMHPVLSHCRCIHKYNTSSKKTLNNIELLKIDRKHDKEMIYVLLHYYNSGYELIQFEFDACSNTNPMCDNDLEGMMSVTTQKMELFHNYSQMIHPCVGNGIMRERHLKELCFITNDKIVMCTTYALMRKLQKQNEIRKRNAEQTNIDNLRNGKATAEAIEKEKSEYSQSSVNVLKNPFIVNEKREDGVINGNNKVANRTDATVISTARNLTVQHTNIHTPCPMKSYNYTMDMRAIASSNKSDSIPFINNLQLNKMTYMCRDACVNVLDYNVWENTNTISNTNTTHVPVDNYLLCIFTPNNHSNILFKTETVGSDPGFNITMNPHAGLSGRGTGSKPSWNTGLSGFGTKLHSTMDMKDTLKDFSIDAITNSEKTSRDNTLNAVKCRSQKDVHTSPPPIISEINSESHCDDANLSVSGASNPVDNAIHTNIRNDTSLGVMSHLFNISTERAPTTSVGSTSLSESIQNHHNGVLMGAGEHAVFAIFDKEEDSEACVEGSNALEQRNDTKTPLAFFIFNKHVHSKSTAHGKQDAFTADIMHAYHVYSTNQTIVSVTSWKCPLIYVLKVTYMPSIAIECIHLIQLPIDTYCRGIVLVGKKCNKHTGVDIHFSSGHIPTHELNSNHSAPTVSALDMDVELFLFCTLIRKIVKPKPNQGVHNPNTVANDHASREPIGLTKSIYDEISDVMLLSYKVDIKGLDRNRHIQKHVHAETLQNSMHSVNVSVKQSKADAGHTGIKSNLDFKTSIPNTDSMARVSNSSKSLSTDTGTQLLSMMDDMVSSMNQLHVKVETIEKRLSNIENLLGKSCGTS